ncbi:MAG: hypothetical protein ACTJG8_09950, partial [Canibacter sp.]
SNPTVTARENPRTSLENTGIAGVFVSHYWSCGNAPVTKEKITPPTRMLGVALARGRFARFGGADIFDITPQVPAGMVSAGVLCALVDALLLKSDRHSQRKPLISQGFSSFQEDF